MTKFWVWLKAALTRREPIEYQYKWVRTHLYGEPDEANVLRHERSGWKPVSDNQIPKHLAPEQTPVEKWSFNSLLNAHERNSYGGMRLYRLPKIEAKERERYVIGAPQPDTELLVWPAYFTMDYMTWPDTPSLRVQIDEYYSTTNRAEHPERQQEYEESERNLAAKGLSW